MFMSHNKNAGHNHNITTANKSFANVAKFKYFGKVTNQNYVHNIKTRLNFGNICYHSVQKRLSFCHIPNI
jgi:hypothetical protein